MPREIDGVRYYSTAEVLSQLDISRQILWRWRRQGKVPQGRRFRGREVLFTEAEVERIRDYTNRLEPADVGSEDRQLLVDEYAADWLGVGRRGRRIGDARRLVEEIDGPVDVLFLDCNVPNYHPCFVGIQDELAEGAVVVADKVGIGRHRCGISSSSSARGTGAKRNSSTSTCPGPGGTLWK